MDHKFTDLLRVWLDTPPAERDYTVGALYLLQLTGNQILYRNIVAAPDTYREHIDYQLRKHYGFRLAELTHEQVTAMEAEVETIVAEHIPLAAEADTQPRGKRFDHDTLPDDIRACFTENLSLLQRMRELHLRLRTLSTDSSTCPDSDRYPFLKELIALDKKLHANWLRYDTYTPDSPPEATPEK